MYIELLQARTATLQRKVDELSAWRSSIAGMDNLVAWQHDFEARESVIRMANEAKRQLDTSDDDDSDEEEEDVEPQPRKKARMAPLPKKTKKVKSDDMGGVRVFAAFAMSFSLVPSASTLLRHSDNVDITPGHVLAGKVTPTEVIARLPLITAEHTSRLLGRVLPDMLVPHPHTMVDWTWRLLVALVLVVLLGPMISRWSRDEETGVGSIVDITKDSMKLALRKWMKADREEGVWLAITASLLGRSKSSQSTRLACI